MKKSYSAPAIEELWTEEVLADPLYESDKDNTSGEGDWGEGDQESPWSF